MASAVDSRLAYARLSAVATASRLPTANRGSNNSYTTSWDTTFSRNLIVEVDCGQHAESQTDNQRTRLLKTKGFRELRFWNHDVLANTEGVLEVIRAGLREK